MFGPVLKNEGEQKMVYSTSSAFRIVFLGSAILLFAIVVGEVEGPIFVRHNALALSLCAICLAAALYLERWVFDKESNVFERHIGLIFFFSRRQKPLDSLKCVSLDEFPPGISQAKGKRGGMMLNRKAASLSIEAEGESFHKLDMAKGSGIKELRKTAEALSSFCSIPLEDNVQEAEVEEDEEETE